MSEWSTYSLEDFLLFSPQTYYRLFELYNDAVWPGQAVALAAGLVLAAALRRARPTRDRLIAGLLAACWLWVGWAYFFDRYATINWAAPWFAAGFAIQAVLLVGFELLVDQGAAETRPGLSRLGVGIFIFALLVHPLITPALGRPVAQMEIFGLAPDPTAIGTLGLFAAIRAPWPLFVLPVVWCAITGATLLAMGSPEAVVAPIMAMLALGARAVSR